MRKLLTIVLVAFTLSGCAKFSADLAKVNTWVGTYAPIIGRDILMIANILVTAECSPVITPASGVLTNVLNIVAPNNAGAAKVSNVLALNVSITNQLCPLVAAVRTSVGPVPNVAPSQIINAPSNVGVVS